MRFATRRMRRKITLAPSSSAVAGGSRPCYTGAMPDVARRRSPRRERGAQLNTRVADEELERYREAADASDLSLSDWVRHRLNRCAEEDLGQ